jgi:F0F1-type ATP synthase delta subunit
MVNSRTLAQTVLKMAARPYNEKHIDAFINYLKMNNLERLLPQVIGHIHCITLRQSESETLRICSKYQLSESDVQYIQSVTRAENAPLTQHIDETVIGGFSASYAGYLYDGSLQNQVTRLKDMLIKS